jgi:hypothetical protein
MAVVVLPMRTRDVHVANPDGRVGDPDDRFSRDVNEPKGGAGRVHERVLVGQVALERERTVAAADRKQPDLLVVEAHLPLAKGSAHQGVNKLQAAKMEDAFPV